MIAKQKSVQTGEVERSPSTKIANTFKQRIVRRYFIRFHMGLMVSATVAAGILASKLLLVAGLTSVLIRYPLAVLGAYLVFIRLIKIWIHYVDYGHSAASRVSGHADPSGLLDFDISSAGQPAPRFSGFSGGDSGGGGASLTCTAP